MTVFLTEHQFAYEIEKLCRLFFPYQKISVIESGEKSDDEFRVYAGEKDGIVKIKVCTSDEVIEGEEPSGGNSELKIAVLLYNVFVKLTGYTPGWGILTGIRPVKLLRDTAVKYGMDEALRRFSKDFLVSDEKLNLAVETLKIESRMISLSKPDSFSLYISIPFCPSRCSYCSFVSQSITKERAQKLIPQYVGLLCREISETAKIAKSINLHLETVYIGGGTPTTLSAIELEKILSQIKNSFDLSGVREFTVEAGRPDTVTNEKLEVLKRYKVERISINPQTFSDEILKNISRNHTADQALDAMGMARNAGFEDINMDIIAGLPGDNIDGFIRTVKTAIDLKPSNITVHTLSLKRASSMSQVDCREAENVSEMLKYANNLLFKSDYKPYYLYRQSRTLGNHENVGWAKHGFEGYYNVFMMDETHTVLACGAGAVTKLKQPDGSEIERIFNYKFPYEYNERFENILERKRQVKKFYEKFC